MCLKIAFTTAPTSLQHNTEGQGPAKSLPGAGTSAAVTSSPLRGRAGSRGQSLLFFITGSPGAASPSIPHAQSTPPVKNPPTAGHRVLLPLCHLSSSMWISVVREQQQARQHRPSRSWQTSAAAFLTARHKPAPAWGSGIPSASTTFRTTKSLKKIPDG